MEDRTELYNMLLSADTMQDSAITFYTQLGQKNPQWQQILDSMIQEALVNKGRISALRDSLIEGEAEFIEEGKQEVKRELPEIFVGEDNLDTLFQEEVEINTPLGGEDVVIELLDK